MTTATESRPRRTRPAPSPARRATSTGPARLGSAASSAGTTAAATTAAAPDPPASPVEQIGPALQRLAAVAIERLARVAADKVDEFAGSLEGIAEHGLGDSAGVGMTALMRGGLAALQGQNPVWAAIKGAVSAMSTTTKVVVGILLILTAVLAPVALLVLAVVLLVLAVIAAVTN